MGPPFHSVLPSTLLLSIYILAPIHRKSIGTSRKSASKALGSCRAYPTTPSVLSSSQHVPLGFIIQAIHITTSVLNVSLELLLMTAEQPEEASNISATPRTSRGLYSLIKPLLYRHVVKSLPSPGLERAAANSNGDNVRALLGSGVPVHSKCAQL